jgi:galactonate dehydratase
VNLVAGAHVMATTPNFYRIESSYYDLPSDNRFLTTPPDNSGGRLKLPGGAGLGLDFMRHRAVDGYAG